MGKTAIPSVFPAEGTYELSTLHVNLSCAASHAVIHYTIDGTEPTADSPIYHREAGLIPVKHTDGAESITIRAFAQADGLQPSDTVAFTYRFACRPKGSCHCLAAFTKAYYNRVILIHLLSHHFSPLLCNHICYSSYCNYT